MQKRRKTVSYQRHEYYRRVTNIRLIKDTHRNHDARLTIKSNLGECDGQNYTVQFQQNVGQNICFGNVFASLLEICHLE